MAGPLAEALVEKLAQTYPEACNETLGDILEAFKNMEGDIGVVPTSTLTLARDHLRQDEKAHTALGGMLYDNHGGRVGG